MGRRKEHGLRYQKTLYNKLDAYLSFSSFFRYPQGLEAFFKSFRRLRASLRILDAGCGTGIASFALLKALQHRGLHFQAFHGFDLTPATLARFRACMAKQNIADAQLREADVLNLESPLRYGAITISSYRPQCWSMSRGRNWSGRFRNCDPASQAMAFSCSL